MEGKIYLILYIYHLLLYQLTFLLNFLLRHHLILVLLQNFLLFLYFPLFLYFLYYYLDFYYFELIHLIHWVLNFLFFHCLIDFVVVHINYSFWDCWLFNSELDLKCGNVTFHPKPPLENICWQKTFCNGVTNIAVWNAFCARPY